MCGILGYNGSTKADKEKIKHLFKKSTSRGNHASGILSHSDETNKAFVLKHADYSMNSVESLIKSDGFDSLASGNCIIGHTRLPTRGTNNKDNAHPFKTEGIYSDCSAVSKNLRIHRKFKMYGVHNGVCSNTAELSKLGNFADDMTKTDSEMLFKYIASSGLKPGSLNNIRGSMALAMMTQHGESDQGSKVWDLSLYRNHNPCFIGLSEDKKGFYFSSIESALIDIGCTNVKQIKSEKIYTFNSGDLLNVIDVLPF